MTWFTINSARGNSLTAGCVTRSHHGMFADRPYSKTFLARLCEQAERYDGEPSHQHAF